jgi:hypothetical protein
MRSKHHGMVILLVMLLNGFTNENTLNSGVKTNREDPAGFCCLFPIFQDEPEIIFLCKK